ncbi:MAG: ABC transporter permease [Oscillatoriales cyanobacterium SM2_2_1]|nr:ABC transporter permease [Oscillatoriales cyanobacterium SM2_2_1]
MGWWSRLRRNPLAVLSMGVLILFYLVAVLAPWVAPYGANQSFENGALLPPSSIYWWNPQGEFIGAHVYPATLGSVDLETGQRTLRLDRSRPSPIRLFHAGHLFDTFGDGHIHLLGTDEQGRDEFSRLLYGARFSLFIGIVSTTISFSIGTAIGAIAGYVGGLLDNILMRLSEVLMSVPYIYLLVALAAVLPAQLSNTDRFVLITVIISTVSWAGLARVIRGQVLSIKESTFVLAARAIGTPVQQILWRHILPQTTTYLIIAATLAVPGFIVAEAVLSLVGLGIQQPDPSWGNMLSLSTNAAILLLHPWLVWSPAIAIITTVLCFNLLGDGLRDAFDPKRIP